LVYSIVGVTDSVPVVAIDNTIFKAVCGDAAEAYRFEYINEEHCPRRDNSTYHGGFTSLGSLVGDGWYSHDCNEENKHDFNLVRGIFSPYLGIVADPIGLSYYDDNNILRNANTEKLRGYSKTFTIYNTDVHDKSQPRREFKIRM